jgi:hypothetical protein
MRILANLPVEFDIGALLYRLHIAEGSADAASVGRLVDWARTVANPKAIYDICYIEDKSADTVTLGGVTFSSRVLSANLSQAHRAFPFVATCGKELEVQPNITGDMMEFYWLDEIKETVLRAAFSYLKKHLVETHRLSQISHMFTGSLADWPLTQQAQLFSLFGDSKEKIGVELTDSFLMIPTKSLSGIFFPTETKYEDCQLCPWEGCPGRRAPYDESLKSKYAEGK